MAWILKNLLKTHLEFQLPHPNQMNHKKLEKEIPITNQQMICFVKVRNLTHYLLATSLSLPFRFLFFHQQTKAASVARNS
jgi:hypothetical protein